MLMVNVQFRVHGLIDLPEFLLEVLYWKRITNSINSSKLHITTEIKTFINTSNFSYLMLELMLKLMDKYVGVVDKEV